MAFPTFLPISHPDQAMARPRKPLTISHKFGDGYEQVALLGINSDMETINPKWTNANFAEGTYIINFLTERKGRPFLYQPNGKGPVRCYRCTEWDAPEKKGRYFDITATFVQTAMF
jgi:phage-related protein